MSSMSGFGVFSMAKKHFSLGEIESTFFSHAADAGVIFTDRPLIADGLLHRCRRPDRVIVAEHENQSQKLG